MATWLLAPILPSHEDKFLMKKLYFPEKCVWSDVLRITFIPIEFQFIDVC